MLVAITRLPGPELARCELTHLEREPIDFARALQQHRAYQAALRATGVEIVELPADPAHPDSVFVEDTAVVLDEVAVITRPTPLSRRGETAAIESALRPFRPVAQLPEGAYLEGGDVLRIGQTLFVGLSSRTGEVGLRAIAAIVVPLGYRVVPVRVTGCLHLKSAACALDNETVLVNHQWMDVAAFDGLRLVDLPANEPWGANVLRLPAAVAMSAAYPRTIDLVRALGYSTVTLDVSELHKAESGLTCMSLIFDENEPFSHRSR
jgi:dimethylargininase